MSRNLRPLLSGLKSLYDRGSALGPFLRRDGFAPTQIRGSLHNNRWIWGSHNRVKGREIPLVKDMLLENIWLYDEQYEQLDVNQAMVCVKFVIFVYFTTVFPEMNMLLNSFVQTSRRRGDVFTRKKLSSNSSWKPKTSSIKIDTKVISLNKNTQNYIVNNYRTTSISIPYQSFLFLFLFVKEQHILLLQMIVRHFNLGPWTHNCFAVILGL